jgi:hypothetical protein
MADAYKVEQEHPGCSKCGEGKTWVVIGPDGFAGGTSYGREEDAEEHADDMSRAFEAGIEAQS